ncbi:putative DNA repair protein Rad26 [Aspergillus clavatus NRRL 1]|uniref:DNA repair protein Rad26, putative n=1 Tax=Aspergillus clavatus (strain ATCC 1007 / CBS 513.65 / DSM 816 / NCTC 3887 / NRRL 1 / QM 1276 / 107) TaxID=344612 RepID=A1CQW3_ASPCL|nr:DNA repair protein Rad26, putative [Aspergillus clavatus NRRL 1]EAW08034.1 DNA repair protein Rad26, putative [Aspergillus clavatus NRRL 1]
MEDDDDFFSDDGFDDLPPSTLLQLEQNAYLATQVQQPVQFEQTAHAPDQRTTPVPAVNKSPIRAPEPQSIPANTTSLRPPARLHTGLTNDYDALDVGELDAEVVDDDTGLAIALDQPPALAGQAVPLRHEDVADAMEIEEGNPYQSSIYEAYNALEEKVRLEEERLKQMTDELATARSLAETKAGEIAIIRSNQAKLVENYDRQLAALRKAMAEEAAKHREEVEAARAEGKLLATENAFLKQDLAEETMRINSLKAKSRAPDNAPPPPVTPKKTRVLPFRDGFDDDEIMAVSPTKSTQSKRMTPMGPGKKKRKLDPGSPTPLPLSQQVEPAAEALEDMLDDAMMDEEIITEEPLPRKDDHNAQLMKAILNHKTYPNEETDIEVMARMAFPSEPQRKLSTILLDETAKLHSGNYVVEYAQVISSLWSRALKEKFFPPVPLFTLIMRYLLTLDGPSCIPHMLEYLVPVLQQSGDINGVPRFENSPVSRQNLGQIRQTPLSQLEPLVDSTESLGLLYQMACTCVHRERTMEKFWRYMRYDFVLMMLNCAQPIRDIILMLNLLATSIRPTSFGSIQEAEQDQFANENYIVDRVANLLSEMPQLDEGQPPYTAAEICTVRLEAMKFLTAVAFNPVAPVSDHGSSVIAYHPTVLARIIRAMHDELDALYNYPPERHLHAAMVNGLMRLVYGVVRRHKNVDLQSKLCRVAGGKQKFLVVLTRLAFSEGPILEGGIDDDTVEMAHEILDDAVNPQEAEALLEIFPSAKRDD